MLETKVIFQTKKPFVNKRRQELFEKLSFFRDNIYEPERVFYPCCCDDITPRYAFPKSKVTFLDRDSTLKKVMKKHRVDFVLEDIKKYDPEPHDLTIILNPGINSEPLLKGLKDQGYVIADDYHGTTSQLLNNTNYDFIGLIEKDKSDNLFLANEKKLRDFGDNLHVFNKVN